MRFSLGRSYMYVIRSKSEFDDDNIPLYWNNQYGWVNISEAEYFSQDEKDIFNLPINGYWENIK